MASPPESEGGTDDPILAYATERQATRWRAVQEHGSIRAAARALGLNINCVWQSVQGLKAKAAKHGYAPDHDLTHPTAPGFQVKGTSTLYDEAGEKRLQWVKTSADREAQEALLRQTVEALAEDLPRLTPIPPPPDENDALLTEYVITDAHLDMLSWSRETGADWDTQIAEEAITGCMQYLLGSAPASGTAIIAQLGDFLHADGLDAVTPTNRNLLDRDTRFEKSVQVAIRTLRRVIDMALAKHAHVHVIMAEGNHDLASSVWLRQLFAAIYEQEPRITVDTSPLPYYAYRHGRTMLAYHHGHLRKMDRLVGFFAAQFPEMWGATKYRYGASGHLHHERVQEDAGMIWRQHQTIAARDSNAARAGYTAERGMEATTYHRDYGRVGGIKVRPEMVA